MKTLKLLSLALVAISLIGAQTGCKTPKKTVTPGINTGEIGLPPGEGDSLIGDGTGGMGLNANTPPIVDFMSDASIQSVNGAIVNALRPFLYEKTERVPIIIPMILTPDN